MTDWLKAVIFASLFCTFALALTPEGRVKTAEKLLCGIVILIAICSPILSVKSEALSASYAKYRSIGEELANNACENSENLNRTLIESELSAYILDKAENIGAEVGDISLELKWCDEGYWYPVSCVIMGNFSENEREKLSSSIESDLGIPKELQVYTEVRG